MAKETLAEAIQNSIVTERVIFASKAGYEHCCKALERKAGPQDIFKLVEKHVLFQLVDSENGYVVDVTGLVTDVCIVAFAVAIGYSTQISSYSIEATINYLRDKYGFGFVNTDDGTKAKLDLKQEHIERILGKERADAVEYPEPNVEVTIQAYQRPDSTPSVDQTLAQAFKYSNQFTPNAHEIESIVLPVSEIYAFQTDMGQEAFDLLVKAKFAGEIMLMSSQHLRLTGKAIDVAGGIMFLQGLEGPKQLYQTNLSTMLENKYNLSLPDIIESLHRLETSLALERKRLDPLEPILDKTPEDIAEIMAHLRATHPDYNTPGALALEHWRTEVINPRPGMYRTRIGEKAICLTDEALKRLPAADKGHQLYLSKQNELVSRHFVSKDLGDETSILENLADPLYDEVIAYFMGLRDPDVSLDDKQALISKLREYVTLPMLIMVLERHYQLTDM
jgi:hypothetical protein